MTKYSFDVVLCTNIVNGKIPTLSKVINLIDTDKFKLAIFCSKFDMTEILNTISVSIIGLPMKFGAFLTCLKYIGN